MSNLSRRRRGRRPPVSRDSSSGALFVSRFYVVIFLLQIVPAVLPLANNLKVGYYRREIPRLRWLHPIICRGIRNKRTSGGHHLTQREANRGQTGNPLFWIGLRAFAEVWNEPGALIRLTAP